jgi:hypothetical protein
MTMRKHGNSDRTTTGVTKQQISVTLDKVLDVMRRYECNEYRADIANAMIIPKLCLRTTRKQADRITESCKSAMSVTDTKTKQIRAPIMGNWKGCWLSDPDH